MDFSGGSVAKNIPANAGDNGWIRKIPWGREWLPTLLFWPREFRGLWGLKKLNMTEQLTLVLLCFRNLLSG